VPAIDIVIFQNLQEMERYSGIEVSKLAGEYYYYSPEISIEEIVERWAKNGEKLYDDVIHGYFSWKELWPYREFSRDTQPKYEGDETLRELEQDIKENGIKSPLLVLIGKNGQALVGEGNHRLFIARKLNIQQVPVHFEFRQEV